MIRDSILLKSSFMSVHFLFHRSRLSILFIGIMAAWMASCESVPEKFDDPTMAIDVRNGHVFEIVMETNPSTGYAWQLVSISNEACVERLGHDFRPHQPTLIGSAGAEVWRFKGRREGSTRLVFQYARPWEKRTPPARVREYQVIILP